MSRTVIVSAQPFTDTNGNNVSALNSGNDWAEQNGTTGQLRIDTNAYATPHSNMSDCCWKGAGSFTTDQYFKVQLLRINTQADYVGGSLLNSGGALGAFSAYRCYYHDVSGAQVVVCEKIVNGTVTALGTSISATFVSNDYLECEATTSGGVVTLTVYKTGVVIGSRTDSSSILTSGKPGICAQIGAGISLSTQILGDNWEAGNLTSGVSITPPVGADALAGVVPSVVSGLVTRITPVVA